MATVYRAKDRRLGRDVAIKIIHRHLRENIEVERRFASEALAVAKVKHPNIVEVYDVSSDEEPERYLVVEFVEGMTLRQHLTEHGPVPPEMAACFAFEVARALCQAHRHGVIHRDVKPENVLLSMRGEALGDPNTARVKLTDFGIAKLLDAQGVTHTGQVLGSPAHMAPEQIEGGDVDARSDVFGVGVLFYEMLTGCLPFEGKNPAQVLRRVLDGTFLPAERLRPKAGSAYGRIAARALSRDPEDRYPSAQALADALERELAAVGITEVRAEISTYLEDTAAYVAASEATIADRVSELGREARHKGQVVEAASYFNRALAYRPDDTALLSEVAGLARRGRFRRRLLRGAIVGLAGLVVAGAVWTAEKHRTDQERLAAERPKPTADKATGPGAGAVLPPGAAASRQAGPAPDEPSEPSQVSSAPAEPRPEEPEQDLVRPAAPVSVDSGPVLARPLSPEVPDTRTVRTPVVGPQNARVRIDGNLVSWFETHRLSVGPHTFEFVPPNSQCCEASPPRTVEIVEGEGDQVVRGVIRFKPAVLQLAAPAGTRASCGIGVVLEAGAAQEIPMSRPSRELTCTLLLPTEYGTEKRQVAVDLRPGRTFTLTGG